MLLPDTQPPSAQVKCRSLVQHLGADGQSCLTACFGGKIPAELNTDHETLNTFPTSIFTDPLSPQIATHWFFMRKQDQNKLIADFASALRTLAKNCDFGTIEDELLVNHFTARCYCTSMQLCSRKLLKLESSVACSLLYRR